MTTSSPELTVHWWPMFAGDVGASHYMLIYRMKLMSALQCRLVLCFVVLEGGDDFRHWSSGCIVRGPGIARAGLRLCGGGWDCVGSSGAPALGWCSVGALLSAGFLFWCFIWVPALKCLFWSVFQGLICTFGWCWGVRCWHRAIFWRCQYFFIGEHVLYQRAWWKNLRNIWKLVSDDSQVSSFTYHVYK